MFIFYYMKLQTKQLSNQSVKDLFPAWTHKTQDRDLLMTHDLDSVLACTILNDQEGYRINGFASFHEGVGLIDTVNAKKLIGVDFAMTGEKLCWDNHVTGLNANSYFNPNSANLNTIFKIHSQNGSTYSKKMAFSTSLQVWTFYNLELPKTDEGKMLLLSIDSAYMGFYNSYFKPIWVKWMKTLGLEELIDFCENHKEWEFKDFKKQYTEKLNFQDGYVVYDEKSRKFVEDILGIELYIPIEQFQFFSKLTEYGIELSKIHDLSRDESVLCYAITSKNWVQYSIRG